MCLTPGFTQRPDGQYECDSCKVQAVQESNEYATQTKCPRCNRSTTYIHGDDEASYYPGDVTPSPLEDIHQRIWAAIDAGQITEELGLQLLGEQPKQDDPYPEGRRLLSLQQPGENDPQDLSPRELDELDQEREYEEQGMVPVRPHRRH